MAPYAVYARFYDATQDSAGAAQYRYLLNRHHPEARTLLELACGTGLHLTALAEHYAAAGLDVSRAMLRVARKKLPKVTFYHQDMVGFVIPQRFDAIICPYDSVNHLLRFRDWTRTFEAAKRHLNPNGVFIFDVNTDHRLRELEKAPPGVRWFGDNFLIMKVTGSKRSVWDWDIKIFERVRGRTYRLHHELIQERAFDRERVSTALKADFRSVRVYDSVAWSMPKPTSQRLFFVCQ